VASLTEQKGLAGLAFLGVAERLADTRGTVQFAGWVLSAGSLVRGGALIGAALRSLGRRSSLGHHAWRRGPARLKPPRSRAATKNRYQIDVFIVTPSKQEQ
jgi:hypothetical protein